MARSVYSVRQVNAYIKNMFTQDYLLTRIYVKGEVSNCKYHTSGHLYFSLKDESGTIACVMFAGQRSGLSFRLREGQQVVAFGSVDVYEREGSYQLYVKEIRLDGAGALYERFLQKKQELEQMGMFAPEYKREIPAFAKKVGVVTAPTGAAIRDIINVSRRRNPYVQLILYPATVQGAGAKESIARGIRMLAETDVDVIIVGRGGGSIEDLWAFNEEMVAKAIFDCPVPVISAVGHETDVTIADYVADLRAPTPSAAAELAVYEYDRVARAFTEYKRKLTQQLLRRTEREKLRIREYQLRLRARHPKSVLQNCRQRTMRDEERLSDLMQGILLRSRYRFSVYQEKFKGLSPLEKLNQGYAYVSDAQGKTVKSIAQAQAGESLSIYVKDGVIEATVKESRERQ